MQNADVLRISSYQSLLVLPSFKECNSPYVLTIHTIPHVTHIHAVHAQSLFFFVKTVVSPNLASTAMILSSKDGDRDAMFSCHISSWELQPSVMTTDAFFRLSFAQDINRCRFFMTLYLLHLYIIFYFAVSSKLLLVECWTLQVSGSESTGG